MLSPVTSERLNKTNDSKSMKFVLDGGFIFHCALQHLRGVVLHLTLFSRLMNSSLLSSVDTCQVRQQNIPDHMTHLCRSVGKKEQHVHFQAGMKLQTSKEEFLVTVENMDPFIKALGTKIQRKCRVVFSDRRCKLYYCLESFRIGKVRNTSVIGEDTNVLVILSFLLTRKGKHLIFTTDTIGKGTGNHATQRDLLNSLENLDKISFCTPYS